MKVYNSSHHQWLPTFLVILFLLTCFYLLFNVLGNYLPFGKKENIIKMRNDKELIIKLLDKNEQEKR